MTTDGFDVAGRGADRVIKREIEREEEQLTPWAQAAYEAWLDAEGKGGLRQWLGWDRLTPAQRRPWVLVADAVLDGYDEEWQSKKAGY